jgi:trans-aconitate methyltransferase
VLDAGCGVGDGLLALRSAWPKASVEGVEWSWPLVMVARLRCRFARVRRGDMWARPWSGLALVYLFQRPESMERAWVKANSEMVPGSWLVSLEFGLAGRVPDLVLPLAGRRSVLAWRVGAQDGPPQVDIAG